MAESKQLRKGAWIAVNEFGIWHNPNKNNSPVSYPSKRALITALRESDVHLSAKPMIRKLDYGYYRYTARRSNPDYYGDYYFLIHLNKSNLEKYENLFSGKDCKNNT